MPAHVVRVNVAQGPVVVESARVAPLREQRIGGAALNVFGCQLLPTDHRLLALDDVQLTACGQPRSAAVRLQHQHPSPSAGLKPRRLRHIKRQWVIQLRQIAGLPCSARASSSAAWWPWPAAFKYHCSAAVRSTAVPIPDL